MFAIKEVAQLFLVKPHTVKIWIRSGRCKSIAVKCGRFASYDAVPGEELEKLIAWKIGPQVQEQRAKLKAQRSMAGKLGAAARWSKHTKLKPQSLTPDTKPKP